MPSGPPRRRRARPVADAPLDALLERSEDLAKGWLLALLEQAPLDEAPQILAADLAREGPRICAAVLQALSSDSDQRRLEPDGALAPLAARAGRLAGAAGAEATVDAIDALHGVIWSALRSELRDPDPELVGELAERLAQVTALLRTAALRGPAPLSAVPGADPEPGIRSPGAGPAAGSPSPGAGQHQRPQAASPFGAASRSSLETEAPQSPPAWMEPEPPRSDAPPLWVGALHEEIRGAGNAALSLLLIELEDSDRILAVESEAGSAATFSAFAQGVRQAVRRQDILVSETASRAWVIARDTGRSGARALGDRIAAAVRESRQWRGAPLTISVGLAVLGEDGRTPAELIEAAEEARFAASARGPS